MLSDRILTRKIFPHQFLIHDDESVVFQALIFREERLRIKGIPIAEKYPGSAVRYASK